MKSINLLPPEKKPAGAIVKFSKRLKEISTVVVIILLVAVGVISALYFTMSAKIKTENTKESQLKNEIKSLEQTEQQLIFVKDRLKKIESLLQNNDVREEIVVLDQITKNLPSGIIITNSELSSNTAAITVLTDNSASLGRFLDRLINSDYSRIDLLGFSYRPEIGYEVVFGIKI
jgi:Tfp pilus assembly protein PilN